MRDIYSQRKRADLDKLNALKTRIPRYLEIIGVKGDPPYSISIRIHIPTARDTNFPSTRQETSDVDIIMPERYPLQMPTVTFRTPIWNPNVYASGKWCYGEWKPTENLELFVIRLMKVVSLDPTIINPKSPANAQAAQWFQSTHRQYQNLFPTVQLSGVTSEPEKPRISWRNIK